MYPGIFAKTFMRDTVEGVFDAVKARGLRCVQFNMACAGAASMPDEIAPALARRIGQAARSRGIEIAAVSGTYNMIHPDQAVRQSSLRRLRTLAAACRDLGAPVITLCSGTRDAGDMWRWHPDNASPQAWADLLHEMEAALRIANEMQVTLAVEPEHANVVSCAARARALLDEMRSPNLKIIIDGANLIEPGGDQKAVLGEAIDLLGGDVVIAHAKDRTPDGGFCAAGQGILDYAAYLRLLEASAYSGPLILHGLAESQVEDSLRFLEERMKG